MQNEAGEVVDVYIPRKWLVDCDGEQQIESSLYVVVFVSSSASGRIIGAKDHASIQINIADVGNSSISLVPCGFLHIHVDHRRLHGHDHMHCTQ